jgi:hypothetical protein
MWSDWNRFWVFAKDEPLAVMASVAMVTWLVLCAASPFMIPLFLRSRILWGISTVMSALCLVPLAIVWLPASIFNPLTASGQGRH